MEEIKKQGFTCTQGYIDVFPYRDIMRKVAEKCNGRLRIIRTPGQVIERHLVEIPHHDWLLNLHVSDTRPLRVEIDLKAKSDFDFTLSEEDFVERIIKKFRNRDIQVGSKEFDSKYLITSNNSALAKKLLKPDFQKVILENNLYSLSIQTNENKQNQCKLISVIQRIPTSSNNLIELVLFYKNLLDHLKELHLVY